MRGDGLASALLTSLVMSLRTSSDDFADILLLTQGDNALHCHKWGHEASAKAMGRSPSWVQILVRVLCTSSIGPDVLRWSGKSMCERVGDCTWVLDCLQSASH